MSNLKTTKQNLIKEITWIEEVLSDLHTCHSNKAFNDKDIPLPSSLQNYSETCNRLKYYISLISSTIKDHRERSLPMVDINGSESMCSERLILQELLLDVSTNSGRTSLHVISEVIAICIRHLEENATQARQCYAALKNRHFANEKQYPREVLGSFAARSSLSALRTPFRLMESKSLPRPIAIALSFTVVLSESIQFLKDVMSLVSDVEQYTTEYTNNDGGASIKSYIGSVMFEVGAYETLSDVLILESATVSGNAAKDIMVSSYDDSVSTEIVVGDSEAGQAIRSAAAQTLFFIVQICGVEPAMRSSIVSLLFPKQCPKDYVKANSSRSLVSRYVTQYDVTLERNSFVKKCVVGILNMLMSEDAVFFLSMFPNDNMRSTGNCASLPAGSESSLVCRNNTNSFDECSPTGMHTFPRLLLQLLQEPISYSEAKQKTDDEDGSFFAEVEAKALAASSVAGILVAAGQSAGNTGVNMRLTLWGLIMHDIEGVGKVLLLNLYYTHKVYCACNNIKDTMPEYSISDKKVVLVDLIDATLSFLTQSVEFYSLFSSERERHCHCAEEFYQYSHRVKLIDQVIMCLRRRDPNTLYNNNSENIENFFLLSSLKVVARAARTLRYFCERCPPLVGLLPCSFVGCDSSIEVLLCAIEPIDDSSTHDCEPTLSEVSPVAPSRQEDYSISGVNKTEKYVVPSSYTVPSSYAYFETIQSEVATSLAITLLRSHSNRNLFRLYIKKTFSNDSDKMPLTQRTRDIVTKTHRKDPNTVLRMTTEWIHDSIANALDGDENHPSFVCGMLLQDDSGRCINDPFNFPDGWCLDETLALELGSVMKPKSGLPFESLRFPNVNSCIKKGVNFATFEQYFMPTQTALDAVLESQEIRLAGAEACDSLKKITDEERRWRSASFWSQKIEPLRRACNTTSSSDDYSAVTPIRLAARVYGHLALALFKHVLKRISEIPLNVESRSGISRPVMKNSSHVWKTCNNNNKTHSDDLELPKFGGGVGSYSHHYKNVTDINDMINHRQPSAHETMKVVYDHLNHTLVERTGRSSNNNINNNNNNNIRADNAISTVYTDTAAAERKYTIMAQKEANDKLQNEFDASFNLTVELSDHYKIKVLKAAERERRKLTPFMRSTHIDINTKTTLRAWSINVVHEGDLFYLAIPLNALTAKVVEAVIDCARRHHSETKKASITTSTHYRERRWFLQDLHTTVMPKIISLLNRLHQICLIRGDEQVQMSIAQLPCVSKHRDFPQISVSNIIHVVHFLSQYFKNEILPKVSSTSEGRNNNSDDSLASFPIQYPHHQGQPMDYRLSREL